MDDRTNSNNPPSYARAWQDSPSTAQKHSGNGYPNRPNAAQGRTYPLTNRVPKNAEREHPASEDLLRTPQPERKKAWLRQLEEESRRLAQEEGAVSLQDRTADTETPRPEKEEIQTEQVAPQNEPAEQTPPVQNKKSWLEQLEEDDKRFEMLEERRQRYLKAKAEKARLIALYRAAMEQGLLSDTAPESENPSDENTAPETEPVSPSQEEILPDTDTAEAEVSGEARTKEEETETNVPSDAEPKIGEDGAADTQLTEEESAVILPVASLEENKEELSSEAQEAPADEAETVIPTEEQTEEESAEEIVIPVEADDISAAEDTDTTVSEETIPAAVASAVAETPEAESPAEETVHEEIAEPEELSQPEEVSSQDEPATEQPEILAEEVPAEPKNEKKRWLIPLFAAILIAAGCCIGIPLATAHGPDQSPDYDVSSADTDTATELPPIAVPETEKFTVTLTFYNRTPMTVSTAPITLSDLLDELDYTVKDSDRFSIDLSAELTQDTVIAVDTVTYATVTETVSLPYETQVREVQTIPKGQKELLQEGQMGSKTITYSLEMVNGQEVQRSVTDETVTKQPIDAIYQLGVGGTLVGADGKTYSYSYYRVVRSVGYDIEGPTYLVYNADETVAAVNLNYIPLNTKMYIRNDQYDFGVRIAADTASMIEGWDVYVWLSDANPQKQSFIAQGGCDDMIVYFLD